MTYIHPLLELSWVFEASWRATVLRYVIWVNVASTWMAGPTFPSRALHKAARSLRSHQFPTGLGTLLKSTTQHKSCGSEDALTQLRSHHHLAPTPCSCPVSLLQQLGDNAQHFHMLSVTLLMQLLDSNKPLHHLRHRGWHGIPLLHHIIQLWHLKGDMHSSNHQVECVCFSSNYRWTIL